MSDVRSYRPPTGGCAQGAADDAAFCLAIAEHASRNVTALVDSMVAALCSAGEANICILNSANEEMGQRIAAATILATVAGPGDLLAAQAEFVRRALDRYAANARALRMTVQAGARACREPLLERLG
jgi:hypothetical protein